MQKHTEYQGWRRLEYRRTPIWVQPEVPDWFVPNSRADFVLSSLLGGASPSDTALLYAQHFNLDPDTALRQINSLVHHLPRREPAPRQARTERLELNDLREVWLHLGNRCNLSCTHCMFASSPQASLELQTDEVKKIIDQAFDLGCRLLYATGGEPLIHPAFPLLCESVTRLTDAHLVTLTNALAVSRHRQLLEKLPRERFHFQVSLDGPEAIHDALRGKGSFERTLRGISLLQELGFPVALAMVVDTESVKSMEWLVQEAARLGLSSVHYLWYFVKGHGSQEKVPGLSEISQSLNRARLQAQSLNLAIDNVEIIRSQVLSLPGTRYDLTNAGWQSLAVGPDGHVYPTAALVLEEDLACGHFSKGLEEIWRESAPLKALRDTSLVSCRELSSRPLAWLTGGGDPDHSWLSGREFVGHDPWLELYEQTALSLIVEQAGRDDLVDRPAFRAKMGERLEACNEEDALCAFTHSNCVLSLAELDGHSLIRAFYGEAATAPNEEIINPTGYGDSTESTLPDSALARSYGCGSPVLDAGLEAGLQVLDLGCGAGIELCIAAERVGPKGRVIGVDMLDEMLEQAELSAQEMADRLGYRNIELQKGFLEEIPLPDNSVDIVISNCVINLTADKRRTFEEIRRVLVPGGRLVVADVCCENEPSLAIRYNEKLRGECIGGALLQEELLSLLEDVGFEGITILKRFPYREVAGHPFYSLTYAATSPGVRISERGVYRGPFAAAITDDGDVLYRGRSLLMDLPPNFQDPSVFLFDGSGAVTNVDIGEGCACFVPPDESSRQTANREVEGCMVCGAPLEYLEIARMMECSYCGRQMLSSTRCEAGHFVCDDCHVDGAPEAIISMVSASEEKDMIRLFESLRKHPSIPVHGPEYHALVPAVIVAAARNTGLSIDERHIRTAVDRGRTIAGGACGFLGACGAALGVGVAFSVILGASPLTGDKRSLLHSATITALQEIGKMAAARCCQRDSWIALQVAAQLSRDLIGLELEASGELSCEQLSFNQNCYGSKCPFWPGRETSSDFETPLKTLPIFSSQKQFEGDSN